MTRTNIKELASQRFIAVPKLLRYDTYTTNTRPIKIGLVFVKALSVEILFKNTSLKC